MKMSFKKGQVIIREGDKGSEAYIISSGKVRVFRSKGGASVTLAVLGRDQIFGEMGMLDDRPRSASVEAVEDTEAVVVGPDDFAALSSSEPELFMFILKSIFERLRRANQRITDLSNPFTEEQYLEGRVFISGLTPDAASALGGAEVQVARFPYKVGRKTGNHMLSVFSHNDLYLPDREPFSVSRNHFSIECRGEAFLVTDRGSESGTLVNGELVGGGTGRSEAPLKRGDNVVQPGREAEKYVFKVELR